MKNRDGRHESAGLESPILIVSKEPGLQRISSQLASDFNLITRASFSEGALEYLKGNLVDCIVIGLSNNNGESVRTLLYNSKLKYPAIPVVIVADYVDLELIRILGSLGADKIISYNSLRTLLQIINEVVPNSSSRVRLSDFSIPADIPALLIKRALLLIEEHYIELMSVQEIAAYIGVSDCLLVKEFRKNNLLSPKKLLMLFKVKHAVNLMNHHELSITTIARLSGFSNSKRFIECFRRVHPGYSPFQFKTLLIKK
jgi:AraC-like DNA-binding protein